MNDRDTKCFYKNKTIKKMVKRINKELEEVSLS